MIKRSSIDISRLCRRRSWRNFIWHLAEAIHIFEEDNFWRRNIRNNWSIDVDNSATKNKWTSIASGPCGTLIRHWIRNIQSSTSSLVERSHAYWHSTMTVANGACMYVVVDCAATRVHRLFPTIAGHQQHQKLFRMNSNCCSSSSSLSPHAFHYQIVMAFVAFLPCKTAIF